MTRKVLKAGIIITMDPELGLLNDGEILVNEGRIEGIGPDVCKDDAGADIIDLSDCIVIPGFVNTHAHLFQTGIRGIAGDYSLNDYREFVKTRLRPDYSPNDVFLGDYFGALEQLNGGVTTVLDWCHVINTPDHADGAIDGLVESGIRAIFAYGIGVGYDRTQRHPDDARRIAEERLPTDDGRVGLALALRSPSSSSYEIATDDLRYARDLGVLSTMHIGAGAHVEEANRNIKRLFEDDLLDSDVNFVHANNLSEDVFELMGEEGVSVSVTPEVEMQMGHGLPATGKTLNGGARFTLGTDIASSISGDMFKPMRFALQTQRALDNEETMEAGDDVESVTVRVRDVLRAATIEGARALGLGDEVGSLVPGKRADIAAISVDDINTGPVRDPLATVVLHADPANVTDVFVGGERRKRGGELVDDGAQTRWDDFIVSGNRLLRNAGLDEFTQYT